VPIFERFFLGGIFGAYYAALHTGASTELARTYAVNALVAMEVFYLFSVRYLRTPSFTLRGLAGTRAVLIAITVVTGLQFVFTYAPFMQRLFESRPVGFVHGVAIVAMGVALLVLLELEKAVRRRMLAHEA
jgi:magnesium-transporting ATPase (P-type)